MGVNDDLFRGDSPVRTDAPQEQPDAVLVLGQRLLVATRMAPSAGCVVPIQHLGVSGNPKPNACGYPVLMWSRRPVFLAVICKCVGTGQAGQPHCGVCVSVCGDRRVPRFSHGATRGVGMSRVREKRLLWSRPAVAAVAGESRARGPHGSLWLAAASSPLLFWGVYELSCDSECVPIKHLGSHLPPLMCPPGLPYTLPLCLAISWS